MTHKIAILGTGAWGTALALVAHAAEHAVTLVAKDNARAMELKNAGENKKYLSGFSLPSDIRITADVKAVSDADVVVLSVPAQHIGTTCDKIKTHLSPSSTVLLAAKGFEQKTGRLLTEVVKEFLPQQTLGILSGPTFADDVAAGKPAAVTIAVESLGEAQKVCQLFRTTTFRPYPSDDVLGSHIGGSLKNVLAIACGITVGLGLGENARASLMTRGLVEMTRLAVALGAKAETLYGLSGLGDLILTCGSTHSRNFSYGLALAMSQRKTDKLVEGVFTAEAVHHLANKMELDMPIATAVYDILYHNKSPQQCVVDLLNRPLSAREGL